ncbi:C6 transcription factor [Aspergillus luchuensis IFO 4308]|nr:C6 transcription factor [Aspergillus luchuensis IFO 4308]
MDVHPSISTVRQIQDEAHVDGVNGEDPGSDDTKTVGLALGFVNEPTTEFYGESSSIMFTRRLLEAMSLDLAAKRTKTKSPCNGTGSVECNIAPVSQQRSVMASPKNQPSSPATFVSETEMDSLLDIHFNDYGSLFSFLHEPTFRDTYNEYKASGFVNARRGWLGVLTMTFAMATHINQNGKVSAKHRFRGSHVLFQRAVSLCSELSVRTVSLDIVHYLLLAVLYLLRHTDACLDVDNAWDARTNSDGQEICRRTWLTIYCLDKILSVTWGRPPAIPDEYIMVKLPSPWVTMTETITNLSNDGDIHTAFFDATVRLLQVVGLSLATQYGQNLGPGDQKIDKSTAIQAASTMRQDIQRWASSLPSCLGLYDTGPDCLKADAAEYRRPVAEHDNLSNGCVADTGSEELTYKQLWSTVGLPSLPDPDIGPTSHGRVIRSILWRIELDRRPAKLHLLSHCLQV